MIHVFQFVVSAAVLTALTVGVQAYRFGPKAPARSVFKLRRPSARHG